MKKRHFGLGLLLCMPFLMANSPKPYMDVAATENYEEFTIQLTDHYYAQNYHYYNVEINNNGDGFLSLNDFKVYGERNQKYKLNFIDTFSYDEYVAPHSTFTSKAEVYFSNDGTDLFSHVKPTTKGFAGLDIVEDFSLEKVEIKEMLLEVTKIHYIDVCCTTNGNGHIPTKHKDGFMLLTTLNLDGEYRTFGKPVSDNQLGSEEFTITFGLSTDVYFENDPEVVSYKLVHAYNASKGNKLATEVTAILIAILVFALTIALLPQIIIATILIVKGVKRRKRRKLAAMEAAAKNDVIDN